MYKLGKPQKSYVSKIINWFLWLVMYKKSKNSVVFAKTFKTEEEAYNFYESLLDI